MLKIEFEKDEEDRFYIISTKAPGLGYDDIPVDEVEVIDLSADAFRLRAQLNLFLLNQFGDKLDRIKRDAHIN